MINVDLLSRFLTTQYKAANEAAHAKDPTRIAYCEGQAQALRYVVGAMLTPQEAEAAIHAAHAHAGQSYGGHPYIYHPACVRAVLADVEVAGELVHDPDLVRAAWLHDVLEDTAETELDIRRRHGARVAECVMAVTGYGATRKARNASAYAKIRAYGSLAAVLKVADRIVNVEKSHAPGPDGLTAWNLLAMYRSEALEFAAAVVMGAGVPKYMQDRLAAAYG
jgi:(p)ppGpp synthase/HD superfamily hydrolase